MWKMKTGRDKTAVHRYEGRIKVAKGDLISFVFDCFPVVMKTDKTHQAMWKITFKNAKKKKLLL